MYKLYLFLMRYLRTLISYKTGLVLLVLGTFIGLLQFVFMGRFLADGNSFSALDQYGGNLLSYLVIGTAFTSFVAVALNSFQKSVRSEQQMGTLEFLLMSNTRLEYVLICAGLTGFLQAILNVSILFTMITLVFGIPLGINLGSALLTVILTITSLSGIGLMSAGVIIVTKVGDPITWAFTSLSGFLSGVLFPVEYLPSYLKVISDILPTTHALHALRMGMIQNASIYAIWPEIKILMAISLITLPLGLLSIRLGFNRSRQVGSLAQY